MSNDPFAGFEVVGTVPEDPFAGFEVVEPEEKPGILASLGKGIMEGLGNIGLGMARSDPFVSPGTLGEKGYAYKELLGKAEEENLQRQEEESKNLSSSSRIAYKAGKWTGEGAPLALPLGLAGGIRGAATSALKDLGIGAGSATLQEGGVPAALADLMAIAGGSAGSSIRRNATPSLRKELSTKKDLKSLAGPAQQTHKEIFGDPASLEEALSSIHFPEQADFLTSKVSRDDAGKSLLDALTSRREELEGIRSSKAKTLYDAVSSSREGINVSDFREWLNDFGRHEKDWMANKLKKLDHNLGIRPEAGEIQSILEELGDDIGSAIEGGYKNRARKLVTVKKKMEEMVAESSPILKEAREVYAEHSVPLSPLMDHPVLSKIWKDTYDAKVWKDIVPAALESKDVARQLLHEIKSGSKSAPALSDLKGRLHTEILKKISSGEKGDISLKSIETFKVDYPGAFVLDPSLSTKLKNVSNAKYFEQELLRKVMKQPTGQTMANDTYALFGKLRKIPIFNKMGPRLSLMSDKKKEHLILSMMQDKEMARVLLTPTSKVTDLLKNNPYFLSNIDRFLDDFGA